MKQYKGIKRQTKSNLWLDRTLLLLVLLAV